jgi:hypothetical protein
MVSVPPDQPRPGPQHDRPHDQGKPIDQPRIPNHRVEKNLQIDERKPHWPVVGKVVKLRPPGDK